PSQAPSGNRRRFLFSTPPHLWGGGAEGAGGAGLPEGDFDQRAVTNHLLEVVALPGSSDVRQDRPPLGFVIDDACDRRQVGPGLALQVEREMWFSLEVPQPPPLAG